MTSPSPIDSLPTTPENLQLLVQNARRMAAELRNNPPTSTELLAVREDFRQRLAALKTFADNRFQIVNDRLTALEARTP